MDWKRCWTVGLTVVFGEKCKVENVQEIIKASVREPLDILMSVILVRSIDTVKVILKLCNQMVTTNDYGLLHITRAWDFVQNNVVNGIVLTLSDC